MRVLKWLTMMPLFVLGGYDAKRSIPVGFYSIRTDGGMLGMHQKALNVRKGLDTIWYLESQIDANMFALRIAKQPWQGVWVPGPYLTEDFDFIEQDQVVYGNVAFFYFVVVDPCTAARSVRCVHLVNARTGQYLTYSDSILDYASVPSGEWIITPRDDLDVLGGRPPLTFQS